MGNIWSFYSWSFTGSGIYRPPLEQAINHSCRLWMVGLYIPSPSLRFLPSPLFTRSIFTATIRFPGEERAREEMDSVAMGNRDKDSEAAQRQRPNNPISRRGPLDSLDVSLLSLSLSSPALFLSPPAVFWPLGERKIAGKGENQGPLGVYIS